MKLRNKKTGEIINSMELLTNEFLIDLFSKDFNYFKSKLDKIQEEWEDYEEPKEFWYISDSGRVVKGNAEEKTHKEIGNYFVAKEEAEKAVEKLKAWKRLKDKGFRFDRWGNDTTSKYLGDFVIGAQIKDLTVIVDDLDLLFGGEE